MQQIVFYIFSFLALLSASMVVFSRNTVKSALFLVLTFIFSSILWLILEAEFLAITLVLVYVGAVMVLFLFVVMMLDIDISLSKEGFIKIFPFAMIISLFLLIFLIYVFDFYDFGISDSTSVSNYINGEYSNIKAIGILLYTEYLFAFEVSGLLLLVGMIAAIGLTFRGQSKHNKSIDPGKQIIVNNKDRIKLIDER